jgi:hypothetical protein
VQLYGSGVLKNDFEGHDGHGWGNLAAFVEYSATNGYGDVIGAPGKQPLQLPAHRDSFYNNTVYQVKEQAYGYANAICTGPSATVLANNTIYTPSGNVTECGEPLAKWQAAGNDPGTVALPASAADPVAFVDLARAVLAPGMAALAAEAPEFTAAYDAVLGRAHRVR